MTVMCCYLESGFLVVSRMFGVDMSESSYDCHVLLSREWICCSFSRMVGVDMSGSPYDCRVLRSRVDSLWFLECLVWI